ncbi:DUF1345 domain-containing protein [Rhodobacter sp. Har01]|uniref:DUF1345 domain-containing protein n=1 Tax=Rhodobacter sp. Har01 TaxID=2883999 RepID=UPI001D07B466|nr:DUF1345 domain-containing protein [Rhodobacter sp. Har01]MCB6178437.1 DUF1345 domain-containing protein [Rhodobacter sp. Har01]
MTAPRRTVRLAPRHGRFLAAFAAGAVAGAGLWAAGLPAATGALVAANAFFAIYLALMAHLALATGPAELRRHAEADDEGLALITLLALFAIATSLVAILIVLNQAGGAGPVASALALAAVPLGWAMVHTLAAFRYAHLFYGTRSHGMAFPGTETPGPSDFLYTAFTIGMTAQVSDVAVTTAPMRRAVLAHSVLSFFYNTVILALAVNAALRLSA